MQIHELNTYDGNLDGGAFLAVDNGSDTGKISVTGLTDPLNDRIDNIIAGGAAPSAAEVTDARLGADGVVYPSLGDAIRTQDENLNNEILSNIAGRYSFILYENKYIRASDGSMQTLQDWSATDYIEVNGVSQIMIHSTALNTQSNAFYDSAKNFISTFSIIDGDTIVNVPSNAKYFRLSNTTVAMASTYALNMLGQTTGRFNMVEAGSVTVNASQIVQGTYSNTGAIVTNANRIRTAGMMRVLKGQIAHIEVGAIASHANYAYYNSNGTLTLEGSSWLTENTDITIPGDGYIIFAFRNSSNTAITPAEYDANITIDSEWKSEDYRLEERVTKPAFNLRAQQRSTVLFDMQPGHGFYNPLSSGNAPVNDTNDYLFGTQSVKLNFAGQATFPVMDLSDAVMSVVLKVNTITSGAAINMFISDDNNMTRYAVMTLYVSVPSNQFEAGVWATVTASVKAARIVGSPDLTKAKWIRFSVTNGTADYNIQSIGYRFKGNQRPCISFTFDDGWSEVMLGAKILGKYNIPATAYIFQGCELTISQLLSLKNNYGWDIELHGDEVFTGMAEEDLVAYIEATQKFVKENGLGDGEHMAYPGGQNNRDVVNVVRRFCKTARTINNNAQSIETIPSPMPYNLRAVSGIGASGTSVATVKETIDKAVASNGWAILVFHQIGDTATSMFCSEADLEEIAKYAVASGADIKTVADMYERD